MAISLENGETVFVSRIEIPSGPVTATSNWVKQVRWWTREVFAVALWSFLLVKLFVFDIDVFVAQRYAPEIVPLLQSRFFALIGAIAFLWLVLGNDRFRTVVAYVFFYPLVVVGWKIPKWLFKNWAVALTFSPGLIELFRSFKSRFISGSLAVLGALTITVSRNQLLVATAMSVLGLYLIAHYWRRFRIAFRPSTVFADAAGLVRRAWNHALSSVIEKEARAAAVLDPASDAYQQKHRQNLTNIFVWSLLLQFLARKLRDVGASRKLDAYYIVALIYTFCLTAIILAFLNLGLQRIDPNSFLSLQPLGFWRLLAFSVGTLLPANYSGVMPSTSLAVFSAYLGAIAGVSLVVFFVTILFTIVHERSREDIDKVLAELDRSSSGLNHLIEKEYAMSPAQVEVTVLEFNPALAPTVALLRKIE